MIDYARRMIIVLIMALFISLLFLGGTIGHALGGRAETEPATDQAHYIHKEEALVPNGAEASSLFRMDYQCNAGGQGCFID